MHSLNIHPRKCSWWFSMEVTGHAQWNWGKQRPFLRLREQNEEILNMMTGKLRKVWGFAYIYIYTVYDYITLYALKCIYYVIHVIICVSMGRRDHLWDSEANSQTLLVGKPGGFSMSNDTKLRSLRKMFFVWVAVCIVKQRQGCLMTSIWKNVSNSQMLRVNACAVSVFFGWLVLSWCCGKAQQAEDGSGCFSTVIHLLEISFHQWYGSFARTRTRNARSEYLWILERLRSQDASTSVWKPYESHETDWFRLTPGKAPNQYLHNFAYISILWIYRLGCVDSF